MGDGLTITTGNAAEIAAFPELVDDADLSPGRRVVLPPCLPEHDLARYVVRYGRPCPRVELEAANEEPAEIFGMLAREETRGLVRDWMEYNLGAFTLEEQAAILNRALFAIHDPEISRLLRPQPRQEAN